MGHRRQAREMALKNLFAWDSSGLGMDQILSLRPAPDDASEELLEFAEALSRGVELKKQAIDSLITEVSSHWKINRMAIVDRNVLRLAIFEMMAFADIPRSVTMNEAIEIARKYGTEDSSAFVNGILDRISKDKLT